MPPTELPPPNREDILILESSNPDILGQNAETSQTEPVVHIVKIPSISRSKSRSSHRERKEGRKTSLSPRSSPLTIARAVLEEERQANQLKALERDRSDRLESEIRRGQEAIVRAEYAEKREKEALAKVEQLEALRLKTETELVSLGQSSRNLQVQLETGEYEKRHRQREMELLRLEVEELQASLKRAQEQNRKYRDALREWDDRMEGRETTVQLAMNKCFSDGESSGYEVGYADGYERGKRDGKQQGIKFGRQEGLREGREQGRMEERRKALEAIDKFWVEEMDGIDAQRTRRWAQSVYGASQAGSSSNMSEPSSAAS